MSPASPDEEWIDLLLKRSDELRRKGILSIGCGGNSAVLAPLPPGADAEDRDDKKNAATDSDEPADPWENPASYPTGHVPTLGDIDPIEKLPDIPQFGDD